MAKKRTFYRPTRAMQEAVNLALAGKDAEAHAKLSEDPRNSKQAFKHFVEGRKEVGPYSFTRKPRRRKRRASGKTASRTAVQAPTASAGDIMAKIDGRTKVVTLLRLEQRIRELLAQKDDKQVSAIKQAMKEAEEARKKLAEAEKILAG